MGLLSNEIEYTVVRIIETCVLADPAIIITKEVAMHHATAKITVDGTNKLLPHV